MKHSKKEHPKISVVVPAYNEEKKIGLCLKSIREQRYPQTKIEIVIVDDDSTDKTLEIAKKYNVKIVRNGKHDYDVGKSIGIKNSGGEYLLMIDADNILTSKDSITKLLEPFMKDENIVAVEPIWFAYQKDVGFFNRYCGLYGVSDPLIIYLGNRDRLMQWERKWTREVIKEHKNYSVAEFRRGNLPTLGSHFLIKKEYVLKTNYDPAFSHLDCMQDLVSQGFNRFAMVKLDIIHLHSTSFSVFIGKLKRNFNIFIRDFEKRRYKWDAPLPRKIYAALAMLTFFIPLYHGVRGYMKIRDIAWFAHPFVCFSVIITYLGIFFSWKARDILKTIH